jgi:hypothetical protein
MISSAKFGKWQTKNQNIAFLDKLSSNHREYFDKLGSDLHIQNLEDWYDVDPASLTKNGHTMRILNQYYRGSILRALQCVYPQYPWQLPIGKHDPKGYWKDLKKQREFFEQFAKQMNFQRPGDWYQVKTQHVIESGDGNFIKTHHGGSISTALFHAFPEYEWKLWKFIQVPRGFWDKDINLKAYISWLADELNICKMEDWYSVTWNQVMEMRGTTVIQRYGGFLAVLQKCFPNHKWHHFSHIKSQKFLFSAVQQLFPNANVQQNYKHSELFFSKTFVPMELDIFLPTLALALEFQGEHHFDWHFLYGSPEAQQEKDTEKKEACKKLGISLIPIPFWWNR